MNLERVELIMQAVGVAEDNIFKKRKEDDVRVQCCPPPVVQFELYKQVCLKCHVSSCRKTLRGETKKNERG